MSDKEKNASNDQAQESDAIGEKGGVGQPGVIGLEPMLQAHIGRKLREYYDSVAREPAPDRFKNLLDRLEAGQLESIGNKGGEAGKA